MSSDNCVTVQCNASKIARSIIPMWSDLCKTFWVLLVPEHVYSFLEGQRPFLRILNVIDEPCPRKMVFRAYLHGNFCKVVQDLSPPLPPDAVRSIYHVYTFSRNTGIPKNPSSSHHARSCLSKTMSSNSGKNIKFFECAQMSYLAYHTGPRYTTSMHWSLTQFTPASMSILTDVVERCEIPCCFCQLHWKYFRNPFGP